MARFGEFCACRANFVPLWQSTTRAGRTLYRIQGGCGVSRHNRTPSATGVEGAGVSGGPVCGAHGRWRAWPGFETTHRATHQQPSATGVEGAGGTGGHGRTGGGSGARLRCPWAAVGPGCGARGRWRAQPRCRWVAAGPGRASRSTTPSRRLACGDLAGGPPPTGTHSGRAPQRSARNTSGATSNTTTGTTPTRPGIQKTDIRIGCRPVVELGGFEPPTFSLRTRRATNCAIAPRTRTA